MWATLSSGWSAPPQDLRGWVQPTRRSCLRSSQFCSSCCRSPPFHWMSQFLLFSHWSTLWLTCFSTSIVISLPPWSPCFLWFALLLLVLVLVPVPVPVPWFGKICSPGRFVLQWKMFNAINRFLKKGPWKNGKFANRRQTPSPLLSVSFLCFLHSCIVSEPSPSCSWYCETSFNPFPMYQVLLLCLNLSPSCSSEC